MTKRSQYTYKFTGTILGRQFLKAPLESKYAGQKYLTLKVVLENQPFKLKVFEEKVNPSLWSLLLQAKPKQVLRKKYTFYCQNTRGYYHLVNWEEVN
jgi:hypothetical protein